MWNELYNAAVKVQNGRTISPFIEAGGVASSYSLQNKEIFMLVYASIQHAHLECVQKETPLPI